MLEFRGSETEKNLTVAMTEASVAAHKYLFYAERAKNEGYFNVADVFGEFAHNNKEHTKIWYKWLNGQQIPNTLQNLQDSVNFENYASTTCAEFAIKAREEGFENIADLFVHVAQIENTHGQRFKQLASSLKNAVYDYSGQSGYVCDVCGCLIEQENPPVVCPLCLNQDV
ncbi:MAG: rubrerythrin family protein [Heliobacteriaceae bacterium]|jgi:rubrerythrin|nr:rubrerythrin family protein [Heliobacteriaceae bacterium]